MRFFTLGVLLVLMSGLLGCAKSADSNGSGLEIVKGSIVDALKVNRESRYVSACDQTNRKDQDQIAAELDRRAHEIQSLAGSRPPNGGTSIAVGPTFFIQNPLIAAGVDQWVNNYFSWSKAFTRFQEIQAKPTDGDWVALEQNVRFLISADRARLRGSDTGLNHLSGPHLLELQTLLQNCLARSDCQEVTLNLDQLAFVGSNERLSDLWYGYSQTTTAEARRRTLGYFLDRVTSEYKGYQFNRNEQIHFEPATKTFHLSLYAGVFSQATKTIGEFIESVWTQGDNGYHVKVDWKPSADGAFSLLLDPAQVYGRAFVSWQDKIVQLYPGTGTRGIAHEMGHVLGFRDHYYIQFNRQSCWYTEENNHGDLMSAHVTGVVTPEEWAELAKQYTN